MKQVISRTSTYSSDEFGICSALYELGGMVVMHDASGCNSTYTTHDEPRWYDMDSMIYISAISEMEAIMGDDRKFIDDLVETAGKLHPKFIALIGAPIPYMIGTDMDAIARIVEEETGIPSFGFAANGMNYYTKGVSMAMDKLVEVFVTKKEKDKGIPRVNILGATPLDYAVGGSVESIKEWIRSLGMEVQTCFAMGATLEEIRDAALADVDLVISYGGLEAAKRMEKEYGIPYVVGAPFGKDFSDQLAVTLRITMMDKVSRIGYQNTPSFIDKRVNRSRTRLALIAESVYGASLATAIEQEYPSVEVDVLCPLDEDEKIMRDRDRWMPEEDDIRDALPSYDAVIADPLYESICNGKKLYPLGHIAFSGRIYEKEIPNLIARRIESKQER